MLLQYRAAAVAGFSTQLFWGFIRVMIFEAFFLSSKAHQPMNLPEVITYIWLGQAFFAMLPFRPSTETVTQIREGSIVFELLHPVNIYLFWFCRSLAERSAPTVLRSIPMLILAGLFFGLQSPASVGAFLFFMISLGLALAIASAVSVIINISLMWTISGHGITGFAGAFLFVFSGMIVPLPFFPDNLRQIVNWLPFRGIIDTPMRIYVGHLSQPDILPALLHQCVWIVILLLLGHWLLSKSFKRLVVQGG